LGLDYWARKLEGVPMVTVPTSRARARDGSAQKGVYRFELSCDLTSKMIVLARSERATLFMVCLAVFKAMLSKMSGSSDIAVPTLTAGRDAKQFEEVVGFFLNALLLRTDLSANPTLIESVRLVRRTCLEAYDWQEVPMIRVLDQVPDVGLLLADDRYVMMPFQLLELPIKAPTQASPGLTCEAVGSRVSAAGQDIAGPFDALMTMRVEQRRLAGTIHYSTALFDPSTIGWIAREYRAAATRLIEAPDLRLSDL
jgi:non-ribosomal peptide synthetase component F